MRLLVLIEMLILMYTHEHQGVIQQDAARLNF